jgi:predicted TIM-barrel fold metal-dependent hydrolase
MRDELQGHGAVARFAPEPDEESVFCPMISVDDHVLEPADIFSSRVPTSLRDRVPTQVTGDDGYPYWEVDGARYGISIANGASGRVKGDWADDRPNRYDEFRRGVWDPAARLRDMDLTGVWAQLGFASTTWGFGGRLFSQMRDREAGLAALRAYNDWLIDEWCSTAPDRYIPSQLPWLADAVAAAEEIRRNADRGVRAVSFSENPEAIGFGSIHTSHWDPFFEACQETVGSSGAIIKPSADSPHETLSALFPVSGMIAAVDWIFARVPIRFPGLSIVLSEGGVTWIPMIRERLIRAYRGLEVTRRWRPSDPEPVDLLRRNFWFCSVEDPLAFHLLDVIDESHLMVESDYPHADSTWPNSQEVIRRELSHLPGETIRRICYGNAARLYGHPEPPQSWIDRSEVGQRSSSAR